MLYANLPMFCSSSIASQCCRLQPLSFTGFLKGYFIACRYHSLGLYGLCSPLALSRRRSLRLHLQRFLFCHGDRTLRHNLDIVPLPSAPLGHPLFTGAAGAHTWEGVIAAPQCLCDLNWLFHGVHSKYKVPGKSTLRFRSFATSQVFFLTLMCIWRKWQCFVWTT